LKADDFGTDKFAVASLVFKNSCKTPNVYTVTGDLTIKVTKPVTFDLLQTQQLQML
jgi:polyisoprenoid-binding protein YceI